MRTTAARIQMIRGIIVEMIATMTGAVAAMTTTMTMTTMIEGAADGADSWLICSISNLRSPR